MRSMLYALAFSVTALTAAAEVKPRPPPPQRGAPELVPGRSIDGIELGMERAEVAGLKHFQISADAAKVVVGRDTVLFDEGGAVSAVTHLLSGSQEGLRIGSVLLESSADIGVLARSIPGCNGVAAVTGGQTILCTGGMTALVEERSKGQPARVLVKVLRPLDKTRLTGEAAVALASALRASALTVKEQDADRAVVTTPKIACDRTSRGAQPDGLPRTSCAVGEKQVEGLEAMALDAALASAFAESDTAMNQSWTKAWNVRCEIDLTGNRSQADWPICTYDRAGK